MVAGIAVERENTALLDQSPRQRLDENALRQCDIARLAAAFVAGFVTRDERHRDLGAGPGMLA